MRQVPPEEGLYETYFFKSVFHTDIKSECCSGGGGGVSSKMAVFCSKMTIFLAIFGHFNFFLI